MDQYLKVKKSERPRKQQLMIPYFIDGERFERPQDLDEWLNSAGVGSSGEEELRGWINSAEVGSSSEEKSAVESPGKSEERSENHSEEPSRSDSTRISEQQVSWTGMDGWGECATWEKDGLIQDHPAPGFTRCEVPGGYDTSLMKKCPGCEFRAWTRQSLNQHIRRSEHSAIQHASLENKDVGRKRQYRDNKVLQKKYQFERSRRATRRNADEAEWEFSAKRARTVANETETTEDEWKIMEKDFKAFLKAHGLTTKPKARKHIPRNTTEGMPKHKLKSFLRQTWLRLYEKSRPRTVKKLLSGQSILENS